MFKNLIRKGKHFYTSYNFRKILKESRNNYGNYNYEHPLLFVAGLPKSGTSWLENMLSEYPGYKKNMLPMATKFEQRNNGSHFLELEKEWLRQLEGSLTVLKLHNWGSENNVNVLKDLKIPYVVLFRDLRDVAVSHYFYVRNTWHHPEYDDYKDLDIEGGIKHFARTLLPAFTKWIYSWKQNADSELGLIIRYEDMKVDTFKVFSKVVDHYNLPSGEKTLKTIIKKYSFENQSGGRSRGEENQSSFYRKGVSGDWKNHFTDEITKLFKEKVGQLLIDVGYEEDFKW